MKSISIGRDDSCDIVINHERVSRFHASMVQEGKGYIYRDMSSNGTVINGAMIKNSDKYIRLGEQVLLAGNIPLPWNKIQNIAPVYDSNQNSIKSAYNNDMHDYLSPGGKYEEDGSVEYKSGIGLIIFGYIIAFLGGWLALLFASILINSKQTTPDGKTVHKYKPSSRTNGWIILGIACFVILVSLIYILNN